MPRKSPFEIDLSPSELRELERRAGKYTLSYFQVVRAKMILLAAEGLSNDEIAARLAPGSHLENSASDDGLDDGIPDSLCLFTRYRFERLTEKSGYPPCH